MLALTNLFQLAAIIVLMLLHVLIICLLQCSFI